MKKFIEALVHIGYWVLYLALLLLFFFLLSISQKTAKLEPPNLLQWCKLMLGVAIVPGIVGFYSSYLILFPKFLLQKKFGLLIISSLLFSIGAVIAGIVTISLVFNSNFMFADGGFGIVVINFILSFIALVNGCIALVIKGFVTWYDDIKLKEELNKKNYEMELALIKSQIDPHFLFNTINNIDILIERDSRKASAYLNELSDIMRFMLYETKTEKISLAKEIEYIKKYIDLQKIRTSMPESIRFLINGEMNEWTIEPMLFIPFIENAFKHYSKGENAFIQVQLNLLSSSIEFICNNSSEANDLKGNSLGGLGRELIEKRLNLLYANRHELTTAMDGNTYKVRLIIYR